MSFFILHSSFFFFTSCARMGHPDGGWFDEKPPKVVAAQPQERGTGVNTQKLNIYFDEFIKLTNATEKVVISPPQMEQPEIRAVGKHIRIELKDSLRPNTTYTVDFSDAISDNNENNPMSNYTYVFSTGEVIDTLQVAGYVLEAENLEPIKGIMVGLHEAEDSLDSPFLRVSRTDSRGYFSIRGVAPGRYTVGALKDVDGDYCFTQRSEKMAFSHVVVEPSSFIDTRQDTLWADMLHIRDIKQSKFVHFTPDNIILRAFDHELTERHYIKAERKDPENFSIFFTAPLSNDSIAAFLMRGIGTEASIAPSAEASDASGAEASIAGTKSSIASGVQVPLLCDGKPLSSLPALRGLNFSSEGAFVIEPSLKGDTVTYWLRDTALINQDTLRIEMMTLQTDTLGVLQMQTDTIEVLSKKTYAKRLKERQKTEEEWAKKVEKRRKRLKNGEELTAADTIMPVERLRPHYKYEQSMVPDGSVRISFSTPMSRVSTDSIHLYVEQDSLWYRAPFDIEPVIGSNISVDSAYVAREWELYTDWIPGARYSLEIDTLAFEDIYGKTSEPYKGGIQVMEPKDFSSLFVNVAYSGSPMAYSGSPGTSGQAASPSILVQLLDSSDKPLRTEKVENGTAEFYYINPGTYFLRAIIDANNNGRWDTGDYFMDQQPEEVYYYHESVECKAKWDITKTWNPTTLELNRQKPAAVTKQKADAEKKRMYRNAQRAAQMGIPLPKELY